MCTAHTQQRRGAQVCAYKTPIHAAQKAHTHTQTPGGLERAANGTASEHHTVEHEWVAGLCANSGFYG